MQVLMILGDAFLAVGSALLAIALILWLLQRRWVRAAGRASGEIVEVVKRSRYTTNMVPVVRFHTEDGREVTFRGRVGSRPSPYRVGDGVAVLYDRASPARAMVNSTLTVMLLPIIFAANAVPFLAAGAVLAIVSTR
jgi:hypothetical protein